MGNGGNAGLFYGMCLKSRDFGQFVLSERRYPGLYTTPVHAHERPLFCVVLDGAYREQHGAKTLQCTPATMLFHAAQELHLERFAATGGRSLIVDLDPAWLKRIREISPVSVENTAAHDGGVLRPIGAKLYREFLSGDAACRLIIEGLLLEITGEFFRAQAPSEKRPPRWLDRTVELIRARFNARLTLAEIGDEVGIHPVHVAQTFRRFQGCTVGEYLRKVRVEYACDQLVHTDRPFVQVAVAAGFADQSHFARTFRRIIGVSPSQYRGRLGSSTHYRGRARG